MPGQEATTTGVPPNPFVLWPVEFSFCLGLAGCQVFVDSRSIPGGLPLTSKQARGMVLGKGLAKGAAGQVAEEINGIHLLEAGDATQQVLPAWRPGRFALSSD